MIIFPCQINMIMARAAAEIRLFFVLVRIKVTAAVGRHAVDPASVFVIQKDTLCRIRPKISEPKLRLFANIIPRLKIAMFSSLRS